MDTPWLISSVLERYLTNWIIYNPKEEHLNLQSIVTHEVCVCFQYIRDQAAI